MMRGVEARLWGPLGFGLLIATSMLIAFALGAWVWNPAHTVEDEFLDPVARGLNIVHETCPSGWDDVSAKEIDFRALSCFRDGWLVVLDADGHYAHAHQDDVPGAEHVYRDASGYYVERAGQRVEHSGVPKWPD